MQRPSRWGGHSLCPISFLLKYRNLDETMPQHQADKSLVASRGQKPRTLCCTCLKLDCESVSLHMQGFLQLGTACVLNLISVTLKHASYLWKSPPATQGGRPIRFERTWALSNHKKRSQRDSNPRFRLSPRQTCTALGYFSRSERQSVVAKSMRKQSSSA